MKLYFTRSTLLLLASVLLLAACRNNEAVEETTDVKSTPVQIQSDVFGTTRNGETVTLYTLTNNQGMVVKIMNYGATITSIQTPDKNNTIEEVTLGFDSLQSYLAGHPFFGNVVGRYGNRIAKGKFTLEGQEYTLATNNGPNHLHGGLQGFDKKVWTAEPLPSDSTASLRLTYLSPDMEEGYPGNLTATVTYTLNNNNELIVDYQATTDKPTVVNLTNHTYFNLTGKTKSDILNHEVMLNADRFVPVDRTLIPTGELRPVEGTPFDFRTPTTVGSRINDTDQQLEFGIGYDHCWVLNGSGMKLAASVYEPESGRYLEVFTEEPGIQFYSGNFLDGSLTGRGNVVYNQRYGLCLETEHFPDSPNQPEFPTTVLNPGETYETQTIFKFSVK